MLELATEEISLAPSSKPRCLREIKPGGREPGPEQNKLQFQFKHFTFSMNYSNPKKHCTETCSLVYKFIIL